MRENLHSMLKRFFLNLRGLFDASVVSLTKKILFSSTISIDIIEIFSANI